MEIDKVNNEYNFSDLDDELNDYEVGAGKNAGFDFDALDFEESKKENLKKQESSSSRAEKKNGRATKKRRVLSKVDYEKLIGPDGLTKLKEQGPKLKFADSKKSKSATIDNLRTIINFYQTWAHGLCPQMKFKDVILQSENVCKEKKLKHYLDVLREEAKNKQNERNDYLSGKTLADEESAFWNTPSKSASRNKKNSSFEDKLKSSKNYEDDLTVIPRLLFTGEDRAEKNSPIKVREEIIDTEPFQEDLEEINQNPGSPVRHNNVLKPRRLVYDDEPDDKGDSALMNQSQEIMLNSGSYPLDSYKEDELDNDDDILGDSPDILIPITRKDQNEVFEDAASPGELRDDILSNNKLAGINQVYEDPTLTSLSPEMNSGSSKRNFYDIHEDNGEEILNVCMYDSCHENGDIADAGSDKENLQPCITDLSLSSKRSTLFFDLGDRYVDLTPIYEEVNGLD